MFHFPSARFFFDYNASHFSLFIGESQNHYRILEKSHEEGKMLSKMNPSKAGWGTFYSTSFRRIVLLCSYV